jgi:hypothetical protein
MHLQLALPDLLWPDIRLKEAADGLALPSLLRLLAKGRVRRTEPRDLESWLLRAFGVSDAGSALYALRADGGEAGEAFWLRADPCHLRVNRDHVLLADASSFELNREEAEALVESLNRHFSADGMTFFPMQPQRWYLRLNAVRPIETTPLLQARGRDIDSLLPRGPEALRWRGMLNEAQMLLHQQPVNDAREARGELPINSIWLWGEGPASTPVKNFACVRSHDALAGGLAQASGANVHPVPESAAQWLNAASEGVELVVLDGLSVPACYGDAHTWRQRLQTLEENWFAPLLEALRAGTIGMLSLHAVGQGAAFTAEITRQDLRHFWRRPKELRSYAA